MVQAEFGPNVDLPKRISSLEKQVAALATRDVLQNASVGANGLLVYGGGSITVQGGGNLNVNDGGSIVVNGSGTISLPTGTLSAGALSISSNGTVSGTLTTGAVSTGTVTASGGITASSGNITATSGTVAAGANVTAGGNVSASGQVISAGIVNSPGTKANTVTVGYSAVYIDSSGNMGGNTSSRRFKTNIGPTSYDLDKFLALPAYSYQRHQDVLEMGEAAAPWFDGMLAEDVEPVMPLHVWHDEHGQVEGIRFEELVTPLIQAVARERHQRLTMQAYYEGRLEALEKAANITPPPAS